MPKLQFDVTFTKENQEKFFYLPFTLPEGVESFTLTYDYAKDARQIPGAGAAERNLIDLAIIAPDGVEVGASGSVREEVFISETHSTPGYMPYKVTAGEWQVLVGAYRVRSEGVTVKYTVDYKLKSPRWLKGDAHLHTVNSDGRLTPAELAEYAKKIGLDWIIITDHNNKVTGLAVPTDKDLLIIPGVELTAYLGHINMWGAEMPFKGGYGFSSLEELLPLLDEARSNGAKLSVNHPTCKVCGWHLPLEGFDFDCVEVWNGPMREDELTAIAWWHGELLKGRKLPAVGGSDFHRDYVVTKLLGMPTTVVYADSNTKEDVLSALVRGRAYITRDSKATALYLTSGDAVCGDSLPFKEGAEVTVAADKLRRGYTLRVYNNDEIILEHKAKTTKRVEFTLPVKERGFVRAEITHRLNPLFAAAFKLGMRFMMPEDAKKPVPPLIWSLTNPIYFD